MSIAPCQDCGRPATFKQPQQRRASRLKVQQRRKKHKGDADHDLCTRCWKKRMDAQRAAESASGVS